MNKARTAVLIAFFINGAFLATWVSRIPTIQQKLNLSEGALGLVLLGLSVGVLTALSSSGGLIARFGSPKVTLVGGILLAVFLPLLALASHPVLLAIALFLFGAAMSAMDVAMNEQAVLVERQAQKPLMSSFHASFSVGGLIGALIGAGMAALPVMIPLFHFLLISAVFLILIFLAYPQFIVVAVEKQETQSVFRLPHKALWALGAVAFCCSIGEGSMGDWSAVYLTRVLNTDASFAALGFAAYSLTMTTGRFMGDSLTKRWQPERIVRFGGLAAAIGFLTVVLSDSPYLALVGFALIGIGLANIIPLAFSAAGNHPEIPTSVGIAGVATIGYAGFLAGPPIIGLVAEVTSLRVAFFLLTIMTISMIFTASSIRLTKSG